MSTTSRQIRSEVSQDAVLRISLVETDIPTEKKRSAINDPKAL